MSITAQISPDGHSVTINVNGRFDFSTHQDFRAAYEQHEQRPGDGTRYVLDLGNTEYMDSSALGMLLMLREHAGGESAAVRIANCGEAIRNVLTIANFQQLFSID